MMLQWARGMGRDVMIVIKKVNNECVVVNVWGGARLRRFVGGGGFKRSQVLPMLRRVYIFVLYKQTIRPRHRQAEWSVELGSEW